MADAEDDLASRLAAVAEQAVPAVALSPHVSELELTQIRSGSEESALEASYRHLASCASCRARLLEVSIEARAVSSAERSVQPQRARQSAALARSLGWAAAAVTVLGLGYLMTQRPLVPERLAVAQRPYTGLMGSASPAPPREKTNIELAFTADADFGAFVVPWDEQGKVLSAPQWFARESSGRTVVVLAPRTFLPHSGKVFGLVVWASNEKVRQVADRVSLLALATPPTASKQALTNLAFEYGARLQWLPLELH
jgi:hypothetical protein